MTPRDATVMIVDMAGTHILFEKMGQGPANRLVGRLLGGIGQIVEYYGGSVIKTVGDQVLAEFRDPRSATAAAIHAQREMRAHKEADANGLSIRIGIHHGPVSGDGEGTHGTTLDAAKGITALSKRQQILLPTVVSAWTRLKTPVRNLGYFDVAGIEGPVEIGEIDWPNAVASDLAAVADSARQPSEAELMLVCGQQVAICDADHAEVGIGRRPTADIVLVYGWVSRDHATVVYNNGSFVLHDRSRNGTWVLPDETDEEDPQPRLLRGAQLILRGSGRFGVGRTLDTVATVVRYGPRDDALLRSLGEIDDPPTAQHDEVPGPLP